MTKLIGDDVQVVGSLSRQAGATGLGNDAAVGGMLYVTTTQGAQVGAGPDTLASYSVPASTLAVTNQSIWWEAWGSIAVTATSPSVTIAFGATTVCSVSGITGVWHAKGRIFRTGAATQLSFSEWSKTGAASTLLKTTPGETLSGAIAFTVVGNTSTAANNDTICDSFIVGWDDANV